MELPQRYPYNPPVRMILALFGGGFLFPATEWFMWGTDPYGFWFIFIALIVGLILIAWALVLSVRRICFGRCLLLDYDSMVLPIGPFQMRVAKIEYTSITRVWRHHPHYKTGDSFSLRVATGEQTLKILPAFLPDNESYRALEEFLNQKLLENARAKKS